MPYHRAWIGEEEIAAVAEVLRSGWITAGPRCQELESRVSELRGGLAAVSLSSCTAGLFLSLKAAGIGPGDEVITTPISFAATANVILHCGATPVFADVRAEDGNLDPAEVDRKLSPKTRAIIPVHVGGMMCDMRALNALCEGRDIFMLEDCAHAFESELDGIPAGGWGDAGAFSFYATKNITAAEGGMVLSRDPDLAGRIARLSRHGLDRATWDREGEPLPPGKLYDMPEPGYKANMTDLQAALGLVQLDRLEQMTARRMEIKARYDAAFADLEGIDLIPEIEGARSAHHLYRLMAARDHRDRLYRAIESKGVQLSLNFIPIHLFSYYRKAYGFREGDLPHSEAYAERTMSLPFFPAMTDEQVDHVIQAVQEAVVEIRKS